MTPDPKWLELLKASGAQTLALSIASGLFLLTPRYGLLPELPDWAILLAGFFFLVCACLTVVSFFEALSRAVPVGFWFAYWMKERRFKRRVREYIPHMTAKDREIVAYLLAHNQKVFQAAHDGGYAAPLIARGIIQLAVRANQVVPYHSVPFEIPDAAWDVLLENKTEFPYKPQPGVQESHPWRVSWMAQ